MNSLGKLIKNRNDVLSYAAIIMVGIIGCYVISSATPNGPRGFSDTSAYIAAARNLFLGNGYGYPGPDGTFYTLKLNPPLYPLALALTGFLDPNLVVGARWLSIFLYFLSILGTGVILYGSGKSIWLTVAGIIIFASFPKMFAIYSSAMSEPLFLAVYIWTVYILVRHSLTGDIRYLICSALMAGLLPLTRYVGLVIPAAILIYLLLFGQGDWVTRIRKSTLFAALSGAPSAVWFAWIYFHSDRSIGGRILTFSWTQNYADLKLFYASFMDIIWGSLPFNEGLPQITFASKYLILFVMLGVMTLVTVRSGRKDPRSAMSMGIFSIFGLTGLVYSVSLLVIFILSTPRPDINDRMLLPLFTSFLFYLTAAVSIWWNNAKRAVRFTLAGVGVLLFLAGVSAFTIKDMSTYATLQLGNTHAGFRWDGNPIIGMIRKLPPGTPIISNNPDLILLWTNHSAYAVFDTLSPAFVESTLPYGSDDSDPAQAAFKNNGYLIIINGFNDFNSTFKGTFGKDKGERVNSLLAGLIVFDEFKSGIIYQYKK